MQSSQSRQRSQGGFTLIELLVVMLILGILAAIALPAFFNNTNVVTAEVCGKSQSKIELPDGTYTLESSDEEPALHGSYRFTVDTREQTITSVEQPKQGDKPLRC